MMRKIRFDYSMKNIPIPTTDTYRRKLIEKMESFVSRIRWKAHFFLNGQRSNSSADTYGMNSTKSPPPSSELNAFEEDLVKMVENIQFTKVHDQFLSNLSTDAKKINESLNVMAFADKTRNIYEMKPDKYNKLLTENITATYKLTSEQAFEKINQEAKSIASELHVDDRMETIARNEAFISLKDHKENFENNPKCRLINPAKPELGKISKSTFDRINDDIRSSTHVHQWTNSSSVTKWFKSINDKKRHTFISFDIVDFYPSITETLLDEAIVWAKQHTTITEQDIIVIKTARKSLLFYQAKPWEKRNTQNMFDVTMGSNDGAETCELIGLYILDKLAEKFGKENAGLYRDDGLIILKNATGRLAEKAKKDLIRIFQAFNLEITATANQKIVNFLDITLNLDDEKFRPYKKPNDDTLYIHSHSNHPPPTIKQLPKSISKRISSLSSDQAIFEQAAPIYNDALKRSGFRTEIEYIPDDLPATNTTPDSQKRNRSRNITWFNPPFSRNVRTNVGRKFLNLIDKHFPASNKLSKIFNRNSIKVSYSCMNSMRSIVNKHNARILSKLSNINTSPDKPKCNCRAKESCPLQGSCLTANLIYQAEVTTADDTMTKKYIGMTATSFKTRYNNHTKSIRDAVYSKETALSSYIWKLKTEKRDYSVKWSILKRAKSYNSGDKRCNLCLEEKMCIMRADPNNLLNKRSEIFSKCRHRNKHRLSNLKRTATT